MAVFLQKIGRLICADCIVQALPQPGALVNCIVTGSLKGLDQPHEVDQQSCSLTRYNKQGVGTQHLRGIMAMLYCTD
jgi:hypothetical protein